MTKEAPGKKLKPLKRRVADIEAHKPEYNDYKSLFDSLLISSPIGLYIVQEGCFVEVSAEFERITGYSNSELKGNHSLILVLPEDRDMVRENAVKLLKGERSQGYEFRIITKTGETKTIFETIASIKYLGKRAVLGNFMNVTEHKKLEENQERLIQELQETLAKINTLRGLLPICAWCKKLRDDEGYWKSVEDYISEHTGAGFTHGMCPDCQRKYFSEGFPKGNSKQNNNSKDS